MARLPLMLAEGRLPAAGGAVAIDRPDLFDPTARAAGLAGDTLERAGLTIATVEKNARDTRDVIAATSTAAEQLDQYRIQLESEADPGKRAALFQQRADQLRQQLGQNMSGAAQLDFERGFQRSYDVLSHGVRERARRDEIQAAATTLDESNNKLLDVALREPNAAKRALHLEAIAGNIEQARAAGILSKSQADAIHKATLEKFEKLQVTALERTNPAQALRLLTAPADKGGLKYMDPLAKQALALQVQRHMEQRSALARLEARALVGDASRTLLSGQPFTRIGDAWRAAATDKGLQAQLATATRAYEETTAFREQTLPQMKAQLDLADKAAAAAGTDSVSSAIVEAQRSTYKALLRAYQTDPMGTAAIRNPEAATRLDAAEAAGDVTGYRAAVTALADDQRANGVRVPALLPKVKADAIEARLAGPASQAQVDEIQRLYTLHGPEMMPQVLAQLDQGKRLPGFVKVIGALGPKPAGDPDVKRILEASKITEADWPRLIPEEATRKELKTAAGSGGEAVRAALAKIPGGPQRYAEFARAAEDVAKSIYAEKNGSVSDAASHAWDIVFNNHFALSGTVIIPKVNGAPIVPAAAVSAYQDYIRANLDKYNIALPPPTARDRYVTEERRREQRINNLRRLGTFVTDATDTGMVMLDEFGAPVPLATAGRSWLHTDWAALEKNADFLRWNGTRLPRDVQERRDQIQGVPQPGVPRGAPPGGSLSPHQWLLPRAKPQGSQ